MNGSIGINKGCLVLDPRTKMLLMIIISIISLTGSDTAPAVYIRLLVMLLPILLIVTIRKYMLGFLYLIVIIIAWMMETVIHFNYSPWLTLILFITAGIITRFLPALLMGYYIVKTTEVATFITSLERMHCPRKLTIPLSVMFRFMPTIKEEAKSIKRAMKMRGIDYKYAMSHPLKYIEFRVVPLLNSIIKIGNELSMASMTRGLTLHQIRTNMIDLTLKLVDWVVMIGIVILCIIYYVI
ncbi:energy-coupling factor transporter transmembrane protein EcfT [Staphylococcus gallinarum]|uniref:Energy-coupling factor transporter transmembrane protein EcfT n=1 Tax=Staphylococcus gallinarum TaxID=1293 RepID=A0A3A0VVN7_STAGA|nr:energy-coupling factor transporter transmembrane component T [Staphylococcus gallinarum]RIP37219.1 energy-coupling factor transporter transmembrane protein EcfT [Staphylococcus gallinarum]